VKRLLYCYRVLLTGIHVLRSGEIEANLTTLNEEYRAPEVESLIDRKRAGRENGALSGGEVSSHLPTLDALQARLNEAFERSQLPDEVTPFDALDDFVVRARLELGRG
jgi:hypothetical protein